MKKTGLLNPQLCAAIARLGHTDTFVVADCGLPIPESVPVVDLAVTAGVPGLAEVLEPLLGEVVVEAAVIASEARGTPTEGLLLGLLGCPLADVAHEEFKRLVREASFVVRTGADVPYANVLLRSGVPF
ncbi:MAG: D-ribose pyranase [Propionibacteriaceae bacterium]|nr:D-ribose pyranase [Propionibacteriaceae bacterium]